MADEITGQVTAIVITEGRTRFVVDPAGMLTAPVTFVLYEDPDGLHTIPQLELARRSWMLSLLQAAFVNGKEVVVSHDEASKATGIRIRRVLEVKDISKGGAAIPIGTIAHPIHP